MKLQLIDAPWCSACQAVMAEIEKLAEFYHSNDEIMIAKIDSTENEVHGLPIFDVPTIALFVRGSRKVNIGIPNQLLK